MIIGNSMSVAYDINDHGEVVGNDGVTERVAVWNGTWTEIGDGFAVAINNAGTVVGANNCNAAALWSGTTMTQLWPCPGLGRSYANSINDAGQVVGQVIQQQADYVLYQATLWNGTTPTALNSLGGTGGNAYWINNAGQVVGVATASDGTEHAVSWDRTAAVTDLGSNAYALAINNVGQIVGSAPGDVASSRAVIWLDGKIVDLNGLIDPATPNLPNITLVQAVAINDQGWIAANGTDGAESIAFLLEPESQPGNSGAGGGALDTWSLVFLCSVLGLRTLVARPERFRTPNPQVRR